MAEMAAASEAAAPAVDDDDAATVADDDRAAERRAIDAFAAVLSSCDGFALEGLDDDGLKRMKRGKMLHGVIALKFPATKREDLRTMARDGGEPAPRGGAADEREAKKLLEAALADGSATFDEVVGEAPAPESGALTVDLWESLNWRRGAAVLRATLEAGVAALCAMLDARRRRRQVRPAALSAVDFGVYGTTHLLGLAYAGELCYVRSLAGGEGAAAWRDRALKLVHRYVFVVEVLMEGCGCVGRGRSSAMVRSLPRLSLDAAGKPTLRGATCKGNMGTYHQTCCAADAAGFNGTLASAAAACA
ncbi:hypothetical protein JL722_10599 [Aureococcus anophagefferens]|nr:hypothetical protein JL722_10599 [Aureococcus anophagefferens]